MGRPLTPLTLALMVTTGAGCGGLATVDPVRFPAPPEDTITFWGHACFYIDVGGVGIVTDPVFAKRTFPRFRKVPAPPPSSYAGARVVLISHAHPDHLDPKTIETFPPNVVVLCPEPAVSHLEKTGREVVAMKLGDTYPFANGQVVAVAAHHPGGRWSLDAEANGRALGYVIKTGGDVIYYTGDTDPFEGFEAVGREHQPNIAIFNINGHLHGEEAVFAALATRADVIIPSHFGAYGYLGLGEPKQPRDYEQLERLLGPLLVMLDLGERLPLSSTLQSSRRGG